MYWEDPFSQGEFYRADAEKAQFEHELTRMIDVSLHPLICSILTACPFLACIQRTCGFQFQSSHASSACMPWHSA